MVAGIENIDDFLMGKILFRERRFDVAFIGAVDLFRNRVVGKFLDVRVALPASHVAVQTV